MIRHLAGIAEIVEDVDVALAFYQGALGLEVIERMDDGYAMLKIAGVLHFGLWSRANAAEVILGDRERAEEIPLGFTPEFEVDDVSTAAEALAE